MQESAWQALAPPMHESSWLEKPPEPSRLVLEGRSLALAVICFGALCGALGWQIAKSQSTEQTHYTVNLPALGQAEKTLSDAIHASWMNLKRAGVLKGV